MSGGFTVRKLADGKYLVTGSIPGWGAANNRMSDQVRRIVHIESEAETTRVELQAQRDLALRKRVHSKGDQRLRTVETTLSRDEQRSAEASAQLIRERHDARTILQLVEEGLRTRALRPRPMAEVVEEFLEGKKPPVLSKRGFDSLSSTVRLFVKEVRDAPSVDELLEWITVPPSRDGRKNRRAYAGQFLRWAVGKGFCRTNPVQEIPVPRHDADSDVKPPILTPAQAKKLLKAARELSGGAFRAYTALSLYAGLRPSEIARLNKDSLPSQIKGGGIPVRAKVRARGGQRLRRVVPIEPALVTALRKVDWKSQEFDVHASRCRLPWGAVRGAAGLLEDWEQDLLRHSYCSYRLGRGDRLDIVAKDAGDRESTIACFYDNPQTPESAAEYFSI